MGELIFKIWFLVAVLPFIIFLEGNDKFANFLKKKDIYHHWDIWHMSLVVLVIFLVFLLINGYR